MEHSEFWFKILQPFFTECDKWYTLEAPNLQVSRFGHIAETYRDKMYVFGGFDGRVLSDLYRYTPGKHTADMLAV